MARQIRIGLAWVAVAACLAALAGCGGDSSPNLTAEVTQLEEDLAAAQQQLADLQTEEEEEETPPAATTPPRTLADAVATPTVSPRPPLTSDTTDDDDDSGTGSATTTPPPTTPPPPPPEPAQTAEATQRAEKFRDALAEADVRTVDPGLDFDLSTRGRATIRRGNHSDGSVSGSGNRSAILGLQTGPGDNDTGKTVVYTDVELTRLLLDHYGNSRDTTDDTRLLFRGTIADVRTLFPSGDIPLPFDTWSINHGVSASLTQAQAANLQGFDTTDDEYMPDARSSYGGSLHGLSGSFMCGADACEVQITAKYQQDNGADGNADTADDTYALQSVEVASTVTGDQLFFDPNSPTSAAIPLYTGGHVGADMEYMVFGYWREDPASPAADYDFHVFSRAVGEDFTGTSVTATYDGIAVGGYAEKDPGEAVETWRQGEFTADINLVATGANVEGTIDDFVATPVGDSTAPQTIDLWLVDLTSTAIGIDGNLTLPNMAGGNAEDIGGWSHDFVSPHGDPANEAAAADRVPPAVTGTFNARIANSLTLVGAFGAEKR